MNSQRPRPGSSESSSARSHTPPPSQDMRAKAGDAESFEALRSAPRIPNHDQAARHKKSAYEKTRSGDQNVARGASPGKPGREIHTTTILSPGGA